MKKMATLTMNFFLLQSLIVPVFSLFFITAQATEESPGSLEDGKYGLPQENGDLLPKKTTSSSDLIDFSNDSSKTSAPTFTSEKDLDSKLKETTNSDTINEADDHNSSEKKEQELSVGETPEVYDEKTSNSEEQFDDIDFNRLKNEAHRPDISFVIETFKAEVDQSIGLMLLLKSERMAFDLRIPEEATIDMENLDNGIKISHQKGEYWYVQLDSPTEIIEIPVIFKNDGTFFVSVDHDDSHMFFEVSAPTTKNSRDTKSTKAVEESNLSIPKDLEEKEQIRIFETTLDASRTTSSVRSWSQFRSAWNNNTTTRIMLYSDISYSSFIGSNSLHPRNSSIIVLGDRTALWSNINFLNSGNSLEMGGNSILTMDSILLTCVNDDLLGRDSRTTPLIYHTGRGDINIKNCQFQMRSGTARSVIRGYNINLSEVFSIRSFPAFRNTETINASAIELLVGGTLTINNLDRASRLTRSPNSNRPVISSPANSFINIDVSEFTMVSVTGISSVVPLTSWNRVSAELSGVNGQNVLSSNTDPSDFSSRYGVFFNQSTYGGLIFHSRTSSEWINPPVVNYALLLEASPSEGGNPTSTSSSLVQGGTTTLNANPNKGYRFSRWEIMSGSGASILNSTASSTTLTMGNTALTIRAVYEEIKQVSPVDPLDPETEINPDNQPELPEEQGLLSIDFVSQFTFGSQNISTQDQIYFAQPQRLLNEDGTVNKYERRPNYIQITDRRPENERDSWELSVRQNKQFHTEIGEELHGAQLQLRNPQLVTAQAGIEPGVQSTDTINLVPNSAKQTLLKTKGSEGTGTWIYRFGDEQKADSSVALEVPKGTTPSAYSYKTTLTWELSAIPDN